MAEQIRARLAEVMEAHWGALHPLLDPRSGRIPAALTESAEAPFPPVDPDRVHFPSMTAVTMDALAGGGSYFLGPMLEGAPVTLEGKTVGYVERGQVVVTDYTARRRLFGGEPLGVSIGPVSRDPAREMMAYGKAVVDNIVDAVRNPPPGREERRKRERG